MLNKIFLMGRLTRDPEWSKSQAGVSRATFTLAVDRDFKGQNGQRETDFVDCLAWRGTADFAQKYFHKGAMAVVEGELRVDNWTDKDGNKRRRTYVSVDTLRFGEAKRDVSNSDTMDDFPEAPPDGDLPF